jgi:UDPglucose 6-dehydrogenase
VNEKQRILMVGKIKKAMGDLKDKMIGILGLSFKPNTDDMREAPSVSIIRGLQREGAKIRVFDPAAMDEAKKFLNNVEYCNDPYEVANNSDALVILTEWNQIRNLDIDKIRDLLKRPILIDMKNIYDPKKIKAAGIRYTGVGRE